MFGWYKLKKFYLSETREHVPVQWDDPEQYRTQLFYPLLTKYLEVGNRYLDAGSGLGGWMAFLRARGYQFEGIEPSHEKVEMIGKLDPELPIRAGDLKSLPHNDSFFDGYVSIGSWEFEEDGTDALMKEATRVLKPGGILILEVPYSNPFRRWTYLPLKSIEVFVRESLLGHKATFAYHMFRKGDFLSLLREHGFELQELAPHDLPDEKSHYGLWVDWPFLRGSHPYRLNAFGLWLKRWLGGMSPWMIATGMFIVARKKS